LNEDIINLLIERGADLQRHAGPKTGRQGFQAIHFATWAQNQAIVRKLLDHDVRMTDLWIEPVHIAAAAGFTDILKILLDYECAHAGGSAQRMLSVQLRDHDYPNQFITQTERAVGKLSTGTALHLAAWAGKDEAVSMLLEYGADVNSRDAHQWTPLHQAVSAGNLKTVKLLLEGGASVYDRCSRGNSALLIALGGGFKEIVEELVIASSNVNAVNCHGRGALQNAIFSADLKLLERLCELGVPFDHRNHDGDTALTVAVRELSLSGKNPEILDYLIDHCSLHGPHNRSSDNMINLACAAGYSSLRCVEKVLKRLVAEEPPDVVRGYMNNVSDVKGAPLYAASGRGDIRTMDLLVSAGADIATAKGPLGSALDAACHMGHAEAIKWLLRRGAGPVTDETMRLAGTHEPASKLLARYNEEGLAGLVEEPNTVLPQKHLLEGNKLENSDKSSDAPSLPFPGNIHQASLTASNFTPTQTPQSRKTTTTLLVGSKIDNEGILEAQSFGSPHLPSLGPITPQAIQRPGLQTHPGNKDAQHLYREDSSNLRTPQSLGFSPSAPTLLSPQLDTQCNTPNILVIRSNSETDADDVFGHTGTSSAARFGNDIFEAKNSDQQGSISESQTRKTESELSLIPATNEDGAFLAEQTSKYLLRLPLLKPSETTGLKTTPLLESEWKVPAKSRQDCKTLIDL
jgi:ankyrin repeat protein